MQYRSELHRKIDQWGAGLLGIFVIASVVLAAGVVLWQTVASLVSMVS